MKKQYSFLVLFLVSFVFLFSFVNAAHTYNPTSKSSLYITQGDISLVKIKADRSMGIGDNEDRFWISFISLIGVTDVTITCTALDGTADTDQRKYTFTYSSMGPRNIKTVYMGNLPTYVDNMHVEVRYNDLLGNFHQYDFYIYSISNIDGGSGVFAVSTESIPEEYVDKDGDGAWDSDNGIGGLYKYVKAPYTLIKWWIDIRTSIKVATALVFVIVPLYLGRIFPKAMIYFTIPVIIGVIMFGQVILEGYQKIT